MSRNDPRAQRALAVARYMEGEHGRAFIQRQAAAERELTTFARRVTAADLAIIQQLNARGGWRAVAMALAQAGLSADAIQVATHTVEQRGGLEGLRGALVEGIQREDVASAASEAADRAIGVAKADKSGSPLAELLADRAFHESATAWYAQRAAQLERHGIGLADGESPAEWMIRTARALGREGEAALNANPARLFDKKWTSADAIRALSEVTGEPPEVLRATLAQVDDLDDHHAIRTRLAKARDSERKGREIPVPEDRRWEPARKKKDGVAEAMAKAAEKLGVRDEPEELYRADSVERAAIAHAAGEKVALVGKGRDQAHRMIERQRAETAKHDRSIRGRLEQADAHLEANARAAQEPAGAEQTGGTSIRAAIEAADAALGAKDDE